MDKHGLMGSNLWASKMAVCNENKQGLEDGPQCERVKSSSSSHSVSQLGRNKFELISRSIIPFVDAKVRIYIINQHLARP
jgi:hypothetical protein